MPQTRKTVKSKTTDLAVEDAAVEIAAIVEEAVTNTLAIATVDDLLLVISAEFRKASSQATKELHSRQHCRIAQLSRSGRGSTPKPKLEAVAA